MLDVEIRAAEDRDIGYIWATFRDSYRSEQPDMTNDDYEAWLRDHLEVDGPLLVAHTAGEPDLLVGWIAIEDATSDLVYVYVRKERRREGIARRLLDIACGPERARAPLIVQHLTRDGRRIKATHPNVRYIPR